MGIGASDEVNNLSRENIEKNSLHLFRPEMNFRMEASPNP